MLARRKPPKMGIRQSERVRSPGHLAWVRGFQCLAFGRDPDGCDGQIEAHHVSEDGNAGMGVKAPDSDAVPLCAKHHAMGHLISPHRAKWEARQ